MRLKLFLISIALVLGIHYLDAKNRALLVGIGNYDETATGWKVIHGNNDVNLLSNRLKKKGFEIKTLTDRQATKGSIISALSQLSESATADDLVYIHFSGHGQLIQDLNKDEKEEYDQSFVCYDAGFSPSYKVNGSPYKGQNHLIDDELFPYINSIKKKVGSNGSVVVVFDSCYSGGADRGNMVDDPDPESDVEWDSTTRGADDEFKLNKTAELFLRRLPAPGIYSTDGGSVTVISACKSDMKNYECKEKHSGRKYGTLSYCLSKLLDKGIPLTQWGNYFKNGTYKSLRVFRESQIPVVETH